MYFNGYELYYRHWKMLMISMFFVLIMAPACIFPRGVYKKWPLNVLELSYFLNPCICMYSYDTINIHSYQYLHQSVF